MRTTAIAEALTICKVKRTFADELTGGDAI